LCFDDAFLDRDEQEEIPRSDLEMCHCADVPTAATLVNTFSVSVTYQVITS